MQSVDILILSNGPGELTTWVRPVVRALRQKLGDNRSLLRISVILSPCPNGTGKEAAIAKSYPEVDRVQSSEHFFPFLLQGKTAENWHWHKKGVVLFLGGDQFFCVVIGKRLGYRTVVYAEWEARWQSLIDQFGIMKPEIAVKAPQYYAKKFTVVGDLMADVKGVNLDRQNTELIGLLPGSKSAKLLQGVPLILAIAQYIHKIRPQTRFVIFVAPTLDCSTLARFAQEQHNSLIKQLGWGEAQLIIPDDVNERPFLKTPDGVSVELWQSFPAHDLIAQCSLCLTTVGANTAELGALAVPMLVLLPTQQLDAMRSWDGLPGLLARLPGIGQALSRIINFIIIKRVLSKKRLFAWPNIWAKQEIVPELLGKLEPFEVAQMVIDYLEHPEKLEEMREKLRSVRGQPGAAEKLAELVEKQLELAE